MKKYSLLMLVAMFLFAGNLRAQEVEVLIEDDFEAYTVGNKLAQEAIAAGIDWWTTWSNAPGSGEDGVIVDLGGNKCAHLTEGNDQVLMLGGAQSGVYDLEFDIMVPNGSHGYFNILHKFNGGSSTWAMQAYLHMTNDGQNSTYAPGHGTVHAGSNGTADVAAIYDEWMHFRLHVDTDADIAQYYYSTPNNGEIMVCEWQWSLDSFGENTVGRELDAMDFFPPDAGSEYYLDNFKCTRIGGETASELVFNPGEINETIEEDDLTSVTIDIENTGTSIGDWTGWVDFGVGEGGSATSVINYDGEPGATTSLVGLTVEEPTLLEVGAMYPASSYGNSVMGTKITKAQYYLGESAEGGTGIEPGTPLVFRIYGQGLNGQPGELLAEKELPANQIAAGNWNIVTFDTPVDITGFNVWATVEFTQSVGGYAMNFDGMPLVPYGDFYRTNGGGAFAQCSNVFTEQYGNFHIRVTCQGTPIDGGWATLSKPEGSMPIGGSDEVTVNLSSIGVAQGVYEATVKFVTNDPAQPTVNIPLTLTVTGVSVEEVMGEAYNIFPNPTSGLVTIEAENINYIAIYNSVGQLVNVVKSENNTVDMSSYDNGVYYFNIVDNAGQNSLQRVVVAK
ncbi:MAG: T9SS type A sorting domain-containing protein [Bacteroidales bacterium]|nr:T9SS type A sorting domain-containing protein [Bacteroidales bacterium]